MNIGLATIIEKQLFRVTFLKKALQFKDMTVNR